mmetsp:Transcript_26949/g.67453  ORF Transcript_26949/g.67453 Transcript_26949/m.67453 type:complete len:239 (-) Transcript_26949:27-743(-)
MTQAAAAAARSGARSRTTAPRPTNTRGAGAVAVGAATTVEGHPPPPRGGGGGAPPRSLPPPPPPPPPPLYSSAGGPSFCFLPHCAPPPPPPESSFSMFCSSFTSLITTSIGLVASSTGISLQRSWNAMMKSLVYLITSSELRRLTVDSEGACGRDPIAKLVNPPAMPPPVPPGRREIPTAPPGRREIAPSGAAIFFACAIVKPETAWIGATDEQGRCGCNASGVSSGNARERAEGRHS